MEPQQPSTQPENPVPTPAPVTPPTPPVTPTPPTETPSGQLGGTVVGGASAAPVAGGGMFKNKNILLAIVVGALLVLGGGAYAVYAYVTNTPDYLLNQATNQFWKNENAMAAKLKISTSQGGTAMTFNGDFAFQVDPSNTKNGQAVIGLGTGSSRVTVTAEVFDETLYFKLGSLQNLGSLAQSFGGDASAIYGSTEFLTAVSRLNDKWFSLSKEELKALAKETSSDAPVSGSVSADDIKQLLAIYNKHPFMKPDKVYADQVIDGVSSAHFNLKVDKDQLKAFLTELKAANLKTFPVTDADIKEAETTKETSSEASIDFWVARDTKKLKQIEVSGTEAGSTTKITVTFVTNLPKLDKIEKPANALPLSKLMETLLGPEYAQMMGGSF
jgi:hypothetical protein